MMASGWHLHLRTEAHRVGGSMSGAQIELDATVLVRDNAPDLQFMHWLGSSPGLSSILTG
jgi:hypothetical protein